MRASNSIHSHKEDLFSEWNEVSAYLLGYLEADGSFKIDKKTIRVYFQSTDKDLEFLQMLKELTQSTGKLGLSVNKAGNKEYKKARFTVSSRSWKKDLERIGYRNDCIPDMPEEFLHHYIRGYFDGDGSIFWSKQAQHYRSSLVFGTKALAEKFASLLRPIVDSRLTVFKKTTSNSCWYISLGNQATVELMKYMYKDATIYLHRKFQRASSYMKVEENLVTLDKGKDQGH